MQASSVTAPELLDIVTPKVAQDMSVPAALLLAPELQTPHDDSHASCIQTFLWHSPTLPHKGQQRCKLRQPKSEGGQIRLEGILVGYRLCTSVLNLMSVIGCSDYISVIPIADRDTILSSGSAIRLLRWRRNGRW